MSVNSCNVCDKVQNLPRTRVHNITLIIFYCDKTACTARGRKGHARYVFGRGLSFTPVDIIHHIALWPQRPAGNTVVVIARKYNNNNNNITNPTSYTYVCCPCSSRFLVTTTPSRRSRDALPEFSRGAATRLHCRIRSSTYRAFGNISYAFIIICIFFYFFFLQPYCYFIALFIIPFHFVPFIISFARKGLRASATTQRFFRIHGRVDRGAGAGLYHCNRIFVCITVLINSAFKNITPCRYTALPMLSLKSHC